MSLFSMGETSPSRKLSLSVKGLQRIEKNNYEKDFAFLLGDKEYRCPAVIADFLSPHVSSLRSQDHTICEVRLETEDPEGWFERVLSLGYGHEAEFRPEETPFLRAIFRELLNYDLFRLTFERPEGEFEKGELVSRLEFLAAVHETSDEDLERLSIPALEAILSDANLMLEDEDSLFHIIHQLASQDQSYFSLLEFVRFEFLSVQCIKMAFEFISNLFHLVTIGIWESVGPRLTLPVSQAADLTRSPRRFLWPGLDSQIVSSCPAIFSMFRRKTFRLLYRGSRDGFQASDFHRLCNGHPNTLTLVRSSNDSVFGGYSPVAWTSRNNYGHDQDLKSFLFTLRNPHNLPPQMFALTKREYAIYDYGNYGPAFGNNNDLCVYTQCNVNNNSYSNLGSAYTNDTGIAGNAVFTGAYNFTVREIEIFEVIG
jgi:hypothetical protein